MKFDKKKGVRRFGSVNWIGLYTLILRECLRFLSIWMQTVVAPVLTAIMFILIFNIAIGESRGEVLGQRFLVFITPGIIMMTVIQNAFANSSSSIIAAKVQGNIVDTLMPPLSPLEMMFGYLSGSVFRGLLIAIVLLMSMLVFFSQPLYAPWLVLIFVLLGSALLGALGIVSAIFANKFDQLSAITNFIITPLAFLSGSFYSIEAVPDGLKSLMLYNPIFYLIDGMRYSVIGVSDSPLVISVAVSVLFLFFTFVLGWWMFKKGYRLKA